MKEYIAAMLETDDRILVVASVWNRRDVATIRCKITRVDTRVFTRVFVFPEDSKCSPKWINASDIFVKLRDEVEASS